jgi:hypothetical protein
VAHAGRRAVLVRRVAAGGADAPAGEPRLSVELASALLPPSHCAERAHATAVVRCWQMVARAAASGHPSSIPTLLQLLGLQLHGSLLLAAVLRPLLLTATLFAGSLWHKACCSCWEWQHSRQQQQKLAAAARPGSSSRWAPLALLDSVSPSLHSLRDYVVAPLAEEWCFRACMVPLLWMQVGGGGAELGCVGDAHSALLPPFCPCHRAAAPQPSSSSRLLRLGCATSTTRESCCRCGLVAVQPSGGFPRNPVTVAAAAHTLACRRRCTGAPRLP